MTTARDPAGDARTARMKVLTTSSLTAPTPKSVSIATWARMVGGPITGFCFCFFPDADRMLLLSLIMRRGAGGDGGVTVLDGGCSLINCDHTCQSHKYQLPERLGEYTTYRNTIHMHTHATCTTQTRSRRACLQTYAG
eukprot:scaffold4014_cov149-Isochrysis_galbana.AAC.3